MIFLIKKGYKSYFVNRHVSKKAGIRARDELKKALKEFNL